MESATISLMKVLVLYRSKSDHGREVEELAHDYKRRTGKELELMEVDTRDGQNKARAYGIVQYPAVLAIKELDGQTLQLWQGQPLPTINDVSYYDDK